MGVRTRIATGLIRAAKAFGGNQPPEMEAAARDDSRMGMENPFGPGFPIGPYAGYDQAARAREFVTGYNIATRPRLHERVSFSALKGLIDHYDVAQSCIRHRIASIKALDWKLVAADDYDGDIAAEIREGMRILKRPDRKTLFKPWLAKYLRDVLAYDAGTLERLRNRAGRPVGLRVISGLGIAPLLDYWGDSPDAPAEAYVQYVNGLPWNWLTRDDLIYQPYDPQPDSIYGKAPIEDVILNANTDLRFQAYFMQRFTEGNLPHAFASAPEKWSPVEIEQFQEYWDGFMYGDQSRKHQIRWVPGGSSFAWTDEKEFTDHFSLFLMRKTCASYAVVPSDLGFTESVNRSSGESQADVQHRVGDRPLAMHVQDIITCFLQDDAQLPVKFAFDLGEEQVDRVVQAQADKIYCDLGAIGSSELREMRYGRAEPEGRQVPRFVNTSRGGPVPLASLFAVAGEIDQATGAPAPGTELPRKVFGGVEGVLPVPPIKVMSLAEQEFGPSAMPPAPPPQPKMTDADAGPLELPPAPVAKEGATAGITAGTGITGYDGPGADDDDDDDARVRAGLARAFPKGYVVADDARARAAAGAALSDVAKAELAAFRRFARKRRLAGEWRDFRFTAASPETAARLNAEGRASLAPSALPAAAAPAVIVKSRADEVFHQLTEDYPAAALGWVRDVDWEGPRLVPFGALDDGDKAKWRASHEPDRVESFAAKIRARRAKGKTQLKKPAVVIFEPDSGQGLVIDGHHRFLGAEAAGETGLYAWVGHVHRSDGPWKELHASQFARHGGDVAADQVGKAADGEAPAVVAAGLAVLAADTGRVLMLQRALTDDDPAAGMWEFPGGHVEPGEKPVTAAAREWCEETGRILPFDPDAMAALAFGKGATWTSGIYQGFVYPVASEAAVPVRADNQVINPDDPDGDQTESIAWWSPADLVANPAVRAELLASLDVVLPALGVTPEPAAADDVAKAAMAGPKAPAWHGWKLDQPAAAHHGARLTAAARKTLTDRRLNAMAGAYLADHPGQKGDEPGKRARNDAAHAWIVAWMAGQGASIDASGAAAGVIADGYMIGAASAASAATGQPPATGGWTPGDSATAGDVVAGLGAGATLAALLASDTSQVADDLTGGILAAMARELAAADAGAGADTIAYVLAGIVEDGALAADLSLTEICVYTGLAAHDYYMAHATGLFRWVVDPSVKNCPVCLQNQAADPRPLTQPWPSGSGSVPIHPRCRCQLIPSDLGS
jgi:8-oxo-dGTP pyrophosphatase MutT (NUDIX family)